MNILKSIYKLLHPDYRTVFLDYEPDLTSFYGFGMPAHQRLSEIISSRRDAYKETLRWCLDYKEKFTAIEVDSSVNYSVEPVWRNGYFPGLDLVALYMMVSHYKPERYFEIGSGTSTKVVRKAIADHGLKTTITSIDPEPRLEINSIVDEAIARHLTPEDADGIVVRAQSNDIVFVDGSHRLFSNSDCMFFFLEILPRLKKGVLVHLHDIYLPFDYPPIDRERYYSEQFGLAIALLENPRRYSILLPNHYVSKEEDLRSVLLPIWKELHSATIETHGCSFWLRIEE